MYKHLNGSIGRLLYCSDTLTIGIFDCPRQHPYFNDSGPVDNDTIVFPSHAVRIKHTGKREILANRQVVTLYNKGQTYQRKPVADYGDCSVWLNFPRDVLITAMQAVGYTHRKMDTKPFDQSFELSDSGLFLQQRLLYRYLLNNRQPSALLVEEVALQLLDKVLSTDDSRQCATAVRGSTKRRHRQWVADCCELITRSWDQRWSLFDLAAEIGTTAFHLSRLFKAQIGCSIHQYQVQLRLRSAVDTLLDQPDKRLTDVALDNGFATPSHFTSTFRSHFGVPPGRLTQCHLSKNWKTSILHDA